MKKFSIVLVLLVLSQVSVFAQASPFLSGNIWLDLFGGPEGVVIYPQYSFKLSGPVVVTGFGFWERAPGEPDFSNHVNTFTWARIPGLSLRTEVGGRLRPYAGFMQVAPQLNLHRVLPMSGIDYLVVSYLPAFVGIRTGHTLIAGGTQKLRLGSGVSISAEGYRRFFPGKPDYTEVWGFISVERLKYFTPAVFVLVDGRDKSFAVGGRFAVK